MLFYYIKNSKKHQAKFSTFMEHFIKPVFTVTRHQKNNSINKGFLVSYSETNFMDRKASVDIYTELKGHNNHRIFRKRAINRQYCADLRNQFSSNIRKERLIFPRKITFYHNTTKVAAGYNCKHQISRIKLLLHRFAIYYPYITL